MFTSAPEDLIALALSTFILEEDLFRRRWSCPFDDQLPAAFFICFFATNRLFDLTESREVGDGVILIWDIRVRRLVCEEKKEWGEDVVIGRHAWAGGGREWGGVGSG